MVDIIRELQDYAAQADCYDPWTTSVEAEREYGIIPIFSPVEGEYDAIVIAVAHKQFAEMSVDQIHAFGKPSHVLCDLKYVVPVEASDLRL